MNKKTLITFAVAGGLAGMLYKTPAQSQPQQAIQALMQSNIPRQETVLKHEYWVNPESKFEDSRDEEFNEKKYVWKLDDGKTTVSFYEGFKNKYIDLPKRLRVTNEDIDALDMNADGLRNRRSYFEMGKDTEEYSVLFPFNKETILSSDRTPEGKRFNYSDEVFSDRGRIFGYDDGKTPFMSYVSSAYERANFTSEDLKTIKKDYVREVKEIIDTAKKYTGRHKYEPNK